MRNKHISANLLNRGSSSSVLWGILSLLLAAAIYVSLFHFGIRIEIIILVVVLVISSSYISTKPPYVVIFSIILASILINNANYTIFNFSATGERISRSPESAMLAIMRAPLVVGAVVIMLLRYGGKFTQYLGKNADVVLLAVIPFISIAFSHDKIDALLYSVWFGCAIITVLAFIYVVGRKVDYSFWTEHIAWLLLLGYVMVSLLVVYEIPSYAQGILGAAYSPSNFYAFACPVVFVAVLVLDRQRTIPGSRFINKIPYWLLLGVGVVNIVPVLWSGKRSAVVAVGVSMLVYLMASGTAGGRKSSTWSRTALIAIVVGATVWFALPQMQGTVDRFERLVDPSVEDKSFGSRLDVWRMGIDLVKDASPLFGVGLNNGSEATEELSAVEEYAGIGLHSTYVAVFIEMGGLGLLLFLIIVMRSTWLFFSCPAFVKWNMVLLAVPPILIAGTEYNLLPGQAVFWPFWFAIILPRIVLVSRADVSRAGNGSRKEVARQRRPPVKYMS